MEKKQRLRKYKKLDTMAAALRVSVPLLAYWLILFLDK